MASTGEERYQSRITGGRVMPPFEFRRAMHFPWALDEAAMMEAARKFEGRHKIFLGLLRRAEMSRRIASGRWRGRFGSRGW